MLKPVEFWDSPDTSVSPDDQKMLTSYFYNSLQTNVQKNFTIVDQPGPGSDHLRGRDYQCDRVTVCDQFRWSFRRPAY